jgi:mono/diheme cytochrome c family protein
MMRRVRFALLLALGAPLLTGAPAPAPASSSAPAAAAPAAQKGYFSCPATFQKTAGWEMNDHDCGTDVVAGTAVFIGARSDDGKRENLYALCCYEGASLLKKAAPDFAVSGTQWKRMTAPAEVTNRHIYRSVCGPQYTGVSFTDCQFQDLEKEPVVLSPLMQLGQKTYEAHCSSCHKSDGQGMPPILPALKNDGVVTGKPAGLIQTVAFGIPGTIMLSFGGKEPDDRLTQVEIAAVLTFIRNSWGNDDRRKNGAAAGGIVTPAEVAREIGRAGR